jgi:hypothetical protein
MLCDAERGIAVVECDEVALEEDVAVDLQIRGRRLETAEASYHKTH